MYFTVTPHSQALNDLNWSQVITFNFLTPVTLSYSYNNGQLIVTVDYTASLEGDQIDMLVNFNQSNINSESSLLHLTMKAMNGPLTFDDSLMFFKSFNILSVIVVSLTILQFVVSTYYHKMIGL
jgi:hypothetical protein